jgi:peptidyl-prolyl cis-trans isomerase C
MRSPVLLLTSILALLTACEDGGTSGKPTGEAAPQQAVIDIGVEIANVDGVPIGDIEFKQAAARKAPANGDTLSLEERKEVLERLVEEKLLYKNALAKGFDKDPKVQKVMVNTLLREEVYRQVKNSDFPDDQLQAYYESHKEEFVVPEKVQIKRILIKVGDKRTEAEAMAEAQKVHAELKTDINKFKEIAGRVSEDPYRRRGGDVGFVPKDGKPGLDQPVVDKAFTMGEGELSEPFRSPEGINIIQVSNKRQRVERTFAQMKGSVIRKVKNEKLTQVYDEYVAKLKVGAKVTIDDAKLMAVDLKAVTAAGAMKGELGEGPGMDDGGEAEVPGGELPGAPMPAGGAPAGAPPAGGPEAGGDAK